MKKKIYVYIAGIILFVLMPFSLWLAAFLSPAYASKSTPSNDMPVNSPKPKISYKWLKVPFVNTRQAQLYVNNKQVEGFKITKRGIEFKPDGLPDGTHQAYVVIKYGFPYYKEVRHNWVFEVDTTPPNLDLDFGGANNIKSKIVSAKSIVAMKGRTETGSRVFIEKLTENPAEIDVGTNGDFFYDIPLLKQNTDIKLKAIDRAGNENHKNYTVIYDLTPPKLGSITPTDNERVNDYPAKLTVSSSDDESWVDKVEFQLGGETDTASYVELSKTEQGGFESTLGLPDGSYTGIFSIYDAAGNKNSQTVSFHVNTTKIVVNRAGRNLHLYKQGKIVKTYRVAVGLPRYPTPRGNFKIINKRVNPTWINPKSDWAKQMPGRIPPGPDNPLGTRAMDLNVGGIRIHGTRNYGSIGRAASHGCIRMTIGESEELFRIIKIGTPITIY